jgi:iron complex outermembrane receptor protein
VGSESVGRLLFVCLLLSILTAAPPARADDAGDVPTLTGVVDTVDVVADRPEPLETLSTFAVVHEVEPAGGIATVAEVVESGVGTHVRRYGGLGAYSTASIRASSPGQVEVYMDGVPLMAGQWGVTNLSDLPLDGLERVEVYRGGAPFDFGTPGVGGVINLVTRPVGGRSSFAALTGGSHGTWKLDLMQSGSLRGIGYFASFDHLRSEGDFDYLDRHGTPENPDDDEIVARTNNDFEQSDLLVRVELPAWRGWRLDLANDVFTKESGVPGIENVHIRSVRYEVFRNIARASLESPLLAGAFEFRATGFHQHRRDRFFNPDDEVGFNRSDTDDVGRAYGANAAVTAHWHAARQVLRMFAETRRERFTPTDLNPAIGEGFTRRRSSMSLSAEDRLFVGESLELTVGYRLQESVDNYTGPVPFGSPPVPRDEPNWSTFHGPSFGARWRVTPRVTARANRTRYARFPSMIELFGASGTVVGNPELTPEEGTTTDAGLAVDLGGVFGRTVTAARAELTLFRAERDDLITFLQNSQRTVKAINIESARVEGAELSAAASVGRREQRGRLDVTAAYTYQDARNTGPSPVYHDRRLPYEPEHALFVRTGYDRGRVRVWHEYRFEGESYRDRANLPENRSPSRHLHGLGLAVELVRGLATVRAEVANLMDERLVDVEGYPLPGRTYSIGIEVARNAEEQR